MLFVKLAFVAILVVSCGSTTAGPAPVATPDPSRKVCETEGRAAVAVYSNSLTLAAALPTTAGAVAHWEYTHNGPNGPRPLVSRWSAFAAGEPVVFCYFDGDFASFSPPGPMGFPRVSERALVITVPGESPWLYGIGPKATNPLVGP